MPGHLDDSVTIDTILQYVANFQGRFALTFRTTCLYAALFTPLFTKLNALLETFLFQLLCDTHKKLPHVAVTVGPFLPEMLRV
ncbi:hypothetical protein ACE8EZ_20205 [Pantoea deleyi]|uniref:hypothetical protein n=1 Tax=Pantoea deleyi TaxID=470932 RepID=UPI0035D46688